MSTRPKRVLCLTTLYPNTANPRFGTFVARSLEALAATGEWDVTVINPIGVPPIAFGRYRALAAAAIDGEENSVHVHRPRFTLVPKVGARLNAAIIGRTVLPLAERLHAETPFDLVDAQFFFPDGPAAAYVAEQMGLPLSIKARGSDINYWGEQRWARELMLDAAERATGLLAVSRNLKGEMEALGMPGGKIEVHYTGLDRDRFRPLDHVGLRAKVGREIGVDLPENEPLLISVGALIERKGQDLVIGALATMPKGQLLLVGKGEDEAHLREIARDLGIEKRVHFLGSVDHDLMPLLLSASDVMVLPTRSEGLANAWVEALACGTPIVTTDVGGVRELVDRPAAGRLVPRKLEAIAGAVRDILAAPPAPRDVAAVVEDFSWERNAQALSDYFNRLIASN